LTSIIEKRLSLHRELENQQKENKALKSRLSRLQALSSVGTATYMIAHEINNLLTPLANYANLALQNPDDKELAGKALQKTVLNCERAARITESILKTANSRTQQKKRVPLIKLVEEVFESLCRDFTKDRITVDVRIDRDLHLTVVPVQIQQVLMNLILNARNAMLPGGGSLTIKGRQTDRDVQIEVGDSGRGIERGELKKVFEPFFSTQRPGSETQGPGGAGLGLAFCRQVIEAHKGRIWVESRPNEASTFKISLPKDRK